tara:strand:+ start:992 stop:1717 length:726 start_codon:yes stop_codon:yes gene_type:complete
MITKNQIKLIKSLRAKKNRINNNLFIAEGEKTVKELIKSSYEVANIFSVDEDYKKFDHFIKINDKELKQISGFKSPNKVVGVFKIPNKSTPNFNSNIIALEGINDPGNLGTIIRLCDWFGIRDIICSKNSVDCYNPKVVQSSMGSISRVNISYMELDVLLNDKRNNFVAADLNGEKLNSFKFKRQQIIFFGNESGGLSKNLLSKVTKKITIPRFNKNVDSLNLSNSVGIILHELKNQTIEK